MLYLITARSWSAEMHGQFGKYESIHELSDSDIVACLKKYGRLELTEKVEGKDYGMIDFHNDYDLGIPNVGIIRGTKP